MRYKKRFGVVLWFDTSSGEGMLMDLATGASLYIHWSAIQSDESFKNLNKHDLVEFTVYRNLYSTQVYKCKVLEPDLDYRKVNTCLDMLCKRGCDILCCEPKYS